MKTINKPENQPEKKLEKNITNNNFSKPRLLNEAINNKNNFSISLVAFSTPTHFFEDQKLLKEISNEINYYRSGDKADNKSINLENLIKMFNKDAQNYARVCYSKKNFDEIINENEKPELINHLIKSGHHSTFEHTYLTFYLDNIPKAFAMVLNNQNVYTTSEKSARYTVMEKIFPEQKELYDKWLNKFNPLIKNYFNSLKGINKYKIDENYIKKLSQENARYMISVFTPTKMVYTLSLRQLNFLLAEFKKFSEEKEKEDLNKNNLFDKVISKYMDLFYDSLKDFIIKDSSGEYLLINQTDRSFSFYLRENIEPKEYFDFVYSTTINPSFAAFAQLQRHRTINYKVIGPIINNDKNIDFFKPLIFKSSNNKEILIDEWISDLKKVAENDFPQAMKIKVYETGSIENFRSKAILRLCGHAQLEAMLITKEVAEKYDLFKEYYKFNSSKNEISPVSAPCYQGFKCNNPCLFSANYSLNRLI